MREFCAIISSNRSGPDNYDAKRHSLGRRPLLGLEISRNQASAFIKAEVSPGPLEKDGEAIAKPDQKNNMDKQPCQPRRNSAQVHKFEVRDRFVPADRRHAALVEIPKSLRLSIIDHRQNISRRVTALLHCNRRNTGQRLAGLMREIRQIADHLNFRMIGNG